MSISRYSTSVILAATLAACSSQSSDDAWANTPTPVAQTLPPSPDPAPGLSSAEITSVKQAIVAKLADMDVADDFGHFAMHCRQGFSIGDPVVLDIALMGATGKIRLSVPVRFLGAVDRGPYVIPHSYIPSNECYGAPPGGWRAGMTSNAIYEVNIEKWQTGWRPADQQKLTPTS